MELTLLVIYASKVVDRCTACLGGRFILYMEGNTFYLKKDRCTAYNKKGNGNNHRGTK